MCWQVNQTIVKPLNCKKEQINEIERKQKESSLPTTYFHKHQPQSQKKNIKLLHKL